MKTNFMKTNFKFLAIILSLGFFLQSCSSDDDSSVYNRPVITDFEYGEGSTHSSDPVAYTGSDLHVEADIYAEATVSSITLEIHSHDLTAADGEVVWDFQQVFNDAAYQVINPTFRAHRYTF